MKGKGWIKDKELLINIECSENLERPFRWSTHALAPHTTPYQQKELNIYRFDATYTEWFHLAHYPKPWYYRRKIRSDFYTEDMDRETAAGNGNWIHFDFNDAELNEYFTVRRAHPIFVNILKLVFEKIATNNRLNNLKDWDKKFRVAGKNIPVLIGSSCVRFFYLSPSKFESSLKELVPFWKEFYTEVATIYESLTDEQKNAIPPWDMKYNKMAMQRKSVEEICETIQLKLIDHQAIKRVIAFPVPDGIDNPVGMEITVELYENQFLTELEVRSLCSEEIKKVSGITKIVFGRMMTAEEYAAQI